MFDDRTKSFYLLALKKYDLEDSLPELKNLSEADWESMLQIADTNFLTPYLYINLRDFTETLAVPPRLLERMRNTYYASAAKYAAWYNSFAELLKEFKCRQIPLIVLKGAYIGEKIYRNIALRAMDDIDLMVKKEDFAEAEGIINAVKQKDKSQPNYELHTNIVYPHSHVKIDLVELWDTALPAEISEVEVLVLSPENLLLHFCLHNSLSHLFDHAGLRGFVDISEIIHNLKIDWEQFIAKVNSLKVRNSTYMMLFFALDLLATPIPKSVLKELEPKDIEPELRDWARGRIFKEEEIYSPSRNVDQFWTSKAIPQKIRLLLRAIFPEVENIAEKYHVNLQFPRIYLYYFRHFYDLFKHHRKNMLKLLLGDKKMKRIVNHLDWLSKE